MEKASSGSKTAPPPKKKTSLYVNNKTNFGSCGYPANLLCGLDGNHRSAQS